MSFLDGLCKCSGCGMWSWLLLGAEPHAANGTCCQLELTSRSSSLYKEELYSKGLRLLEKHMHGTPRITWMRHILNLNVPRGSRWTRMGRNWKSISISESLPPPSKGQTSSPLIDPWGATVCRLRARIGLAPPSLYPLLLPSCVTLSNLLNLSMPQIPFL